MIKRLILILIVFVLFMPSIYANANYTDVPQSYFAYHDIRVLNDRDIINGYADGKFKPGEVITRKQAAMMLVRTFKLSKKERDIEMNDVLTSTAGYHEIQAAVQHGIFHLKGNHFFPDDPLIREDMAKALTIAFNIKGNGKTSFKDVPMNNPYYKYIDAIAYNDITTGYSDSTFKPKEVVTRAQFSAFLGRGIRFPREFEVKINGKQVANFTSKDDAIEFALPYDNATIHPVDKPYQSFSKEFLQSEQTGIGKGVLIYNGYEIERNPLYNQLYTPEFFKPYIAYKQNHQYIGKMFDSIIIVGREYPYGSFAEGNGNHADYGDWSWYLDSTIGKQGIVNTINQSVQELPATDHVNLFISIPYPKRNEPFIEFDGSEVENTLQSRYNIARWYIDEVIRRFEQSGYKGTILKGFYWLNETVTNAEDEKLLHMISEYLKEQGYHFVYSPHALSTNFENWDYIGFEGAFLQSNAHKVKFSDKKVKTKLHDGFIRAQVRNSGLNLEIENHGLNTLDFGIENFQTYLHFAKIYGAQNKSIIVYQGASMIHRLATYTDSRYQQLYDELHTFLDGQ